MIALDLLGLTADECRAHARRAVGRGAGLAEAVYRAAMHTGELRAEALGAGADRVARWRAAFRCRLPGVVREQRERSGRGRTTIKLVLCGSDERLEYESVLIPMGALHTTQCLSTQIGCRMGCRFCETARMGRLRDLEAGEIVGQVVLAATVLGARPRGLVFQGMGEPLDNTDAVLQALRVLTDRRGLGYAQGRLTVCTVGRPEGIARLAGLGYRRLNLAFSLNAADDALRRSLMPSHRGYTLAELQRSLIAYRQRRNAELAIHYCLLPGINDTAHDARAVARFVAPLGRSVVHLIPYNPGRRPLCRAPHAGEVARFVDWLRAADVAVRRRNTKGATVMAACGQLGNPQLRRACQR